MRILIITEYYRLVYRNGSEVFCRALVDYLQKQGHQLDILARVGVRHSRNPSALSYAIEDRMVNDGLALADYLTSHVDVAKYDLVYNLGGLIFGCNIVYLLSLTNPALPLVNHFEILLDPLARTEGYGTQTVLLKGASQKAVAGLALLNIFVSHPEIQAAIAAGYPLEHSMLTMIPNGLTTEPFDTIEADSSFVEGGGVSQAKRSLVVVAAGRFSAFNKGADLLYRAFARLYRERQDLFLLVISNSRRFDYLLKDIPPSHYRICNWLPRKTYLRAMAAADVVVVPSRYEPFGMVALEAMFLSKAVVANSVGGLSEMVQHGVTGWLNPLEAGSAGLYLSLRALPAEPDGLAAAGRAGRDLAQAEYNMERVGAMAVRALEKAAFAYRAKGYARAEAGRSSLVQ